MNMSLEKFLAFVNIIKYEIYKKKEVCLKMILYMLNFYLKKKKKSKML
jgi:hypothetical protein